ncbi:MAG: NTP transferase domain-containing protein [Candidatus Margulisbacteria bacterium]|nr:NTP transferase domain-containing protein [Candidatus Margulisiibacteriota bacterium]
MKTVAVILGAGKGVRMQSDPPAGEAGLPKVFHKLAGKPMLEHVIDAVKEAGIEKVFVVVGHKKEMIKDYFKGHDVVFVDQDQQLGTGHAVMMAEPHLKDFQGQVVVLAGDVPLIKPATIKKLIEFNLARRASATDLTAVLPDAGNYGRIVRKPDGEIVRIVEKKDASPEELKIKEINTGTFCFNASDLFAALKEVKAENAQKEYYLTDTIEILRSHGKHVYALATDDPFEVLGVNTKEELARLELLHKRGR